MSTWVNFKELRARLKFEDVLRHYKVEVKRKGNQHHGFCPLPNHNGKKNSPSFSADLARGIFQCFGCGAKGNVLEFAVLMENASVEDGAAFRRVALALQERFCAEAEKPVGKKPKKSKETPPSKAPELPVVINPPLDFELKDLDYEHPYLRNRGFTPETVSHFGLGVSSRGLLKDRLAIPLHDHDGTLVGYAGRVVDDATITEDNPRYRFPSRREREGKILEFHKSLFLYNGYRVKTPVEVIDVLIVVEGFASVWWLHQNGWQNTVAVMGADCSEKQAELIVSLVEPNGRVWVLGDGDEAGRRFAQSVLAQVSPHRFVRWMKIDEGKQPTDLSAEQLTARFTL